MRVRDRFSTHALKIYISRKLCNAFGVGIEQGCGYMFYGVHYLSSRFYSLAGTICILPLFLIVFLSVLSPRSHTNTETENNVSLVFPCAFMRFQTVHTASLWYFKDCKVWHHFHPVCERGSVRVSYIWW